MFFTYDQNNSGGGWDKDENIDKTVIIEAANAREANSRALDIGLYFNGCDKDLDCPCCGDRWYKCDDDDGTEEPEIYGQSAYHSTTQFSPDTIKIHFLDGTVETTKQIKVK